MEKFQIINKLIRDRNELFQQVLFGKISNKELGALFLIAVIFYAIFGAIIGSIWASGNDALLGLQQSLISSIKLPMLYLITSAICFPTLFFFLSFVGIKQNGRQLLSLILIALTITSVILASFAPVSLFFRITAQNYYFFKLINIGIIGIASSIGFYLYYKAISKAISEINEESAQVKGRVFLWLWMLLFAIIGAQLSYTLSPFFGDPTQAATLFGGGESNFISDVIITIKNL